MLGSVEKETSKMIDIKPDECSKPKWHLTVANNMA